MKNSTMDMNTSAGDLNGYVAKNISRFRKKAGLTQAEVARSLSLEKETISRIECGKIHLNLPRLSQFASVLNCSPLDLVAGEPDTVHKQALNIVSMLHGIPGEDREALMCFFYRTIKNIQERNNSGRTQ